MKQPIQFGLLVIYAVLLAGCAGTSVKTRQVVRFPNQAASVEDSQNARIFVLRPPGDGPFTYLVKDGTKRIGSTSEGGYLCWERAPGEIVLASHFDEFVNVLNLQIQKNTVYYVRQKVALRAFGHAHTKLESLDQEEGLKLLKKCRPPIANTELASPIKAASTAGIDLTRYQVATVVPFAKEPGKPIDGNIGSDFADEVHEVLKNTFGQIFREVRFGAPTGAADELIITGTIKAYDPGSRTARLLIVGAGAASFNAEMVLMDASSQKVLLSAPLEKLWAWGGMSGASKGVEDMISQSAVAVAATVAQGKGWKPNNN